MLIRRPPDIRSSEITPKSVYVNRREFIRVSGGALAAAGTGILGFGWLAGVAAAPPRRPRGGAKPSAYSTDEKPNTWEQITTYNNYYEFGTDKDDPARNAHSLKPEPWSVAVDGECNKKAVYHVEDILKGETLEDRIYRHRCVEAW